jgi:hypothetical protein
MTITTRIAFDDGETLAEDVLSDGKLIGSIWFEPPLFSTYGVWCSRRMIAGGPYWAPNAEEHRDREAALSVFDQTNSPR